MKIPVFKTHPGGQSNLEMACNHKRPGMGEFSVCFVYVSCMCMCICVWRVSLVCVLSMCVCAQCVCLVYVCVRVRVCALVCLQYSSSDQNGHGALLPRGGLAVRALLVVGKGNPTADDAPCPARVHHLQELTGAFPVKQARGAGPGCGDTTQHFRRGVPQIHWPVRGEGLHLQNQPRPHLCHVQMYAVRRQDTERRAQDHPRSQNSRDVVVPSGGINTRCSPSDKHVNVCIYNAYYKFDTNNAHELKNHTIIGHTCAT